MTRRNGLALRYIFGPTLREVRHPVVALDETMIERVVAKQIRPLVPGPMCCRTWRVAIGAIVVPPIRRTPDAILLVCNGEQSSSHFGSLFQLLDHRRRPWFCIRHEVSSVEWRVA